MHITAQPAVQSSAKDVNVGADATDVQTRVRE